VPLCKSQRLAFKNFTETPCDQPLFSRLCESLTQSPTVSHFDAYFRIAARFLDELLPVFRAFLANRKIFLEEFDRPLLNRLYLRTCHYNVIQQQ
jgi:hypothetical protein